MTEKIGVAHFYRNEWVFGGRLSYMKRQQGEFGASIKIRGVSCRNTGSAQTCEVTCLIPGDVYERFGDIALHDMVVVAGHVEILRRFRGEREVGKQMMIVDNLLEVSKKTNSED